MNLINKKKLNSGGGEVCIDDEGDVFQGRRDRVRHERCVPSVPVDHATKCDRHRRWLSALSLLGPVLVAGCATESQQSFTARMESVSASISRSIDPTMQSLTRSASPYADMMAKSLANSGARLSRYVAQRETLKNNKDTGEHNEGSLIALLKGIGVTDRGGANNDAPADAPERRPALPDTSGGQWRWPVDAGIITSKFGARWGKQHRGMDIAADIGEPVIAMSDGEVVYSDNKMRGYGNVVVIKHADNVTTLYAHNSKLIAKVGEKVSKGTLVALLGNTGRSTGPHVHFEIRQGKDAIDPLALLPATHLPVALHDDEPATRLAGHLLDRSPDHHHDLCDHPPIDDAFIAMLARD